MPDRPVLELPSDRPALLLDVDGVINVFQCSLARETRVAPHLPAIRLLPGLADWLAALDQAYYLIWCSLWGELLAIDAATAWGLAPRPLIEPAPGESLRPDWKARAVARALDPWPGAVAWVEDGFTPEAHAWAAGRLARGRRTWLVDVAETGLNAEITKYLLEWAELER
ncbi:MAG: hypothetical protein IPO81_24240 [Kouleothrix sp.]|nr:hypothetical protein [Kouleothrix sp.]